MPSETKVQANCKRVAALLQKERERKNLSMTALAARSGLSQPSLSYIERGMRIPNLDTLFRITEALEIDLGALIQRATKAARNSSKA